MRGRVIVTLAALAVAPLFARAATVKKTDDTTVVGPLVALENGAVVLDVTTGNKTQRTPVALDDVVELTIDAAVDVPMISATTKPSTAPAGAPSPAEAAKADGEFVGLFDGKTLKNWEADAEIVSVRDGALTLTGTEATAQNRTAYLIYTGGPFDDFELHYRYKLVGGRKNSSGLQFRSRVTESNGVKDVTGYQQDLGWPPELCGGFVDSGNSVGGKSLKALPGERVTYAADGTRQAASLDKDAGQLNAVLRENDWNDATLIAQGNRIVSIINGEVFADVTNDFPGAPRTGVLAFQFSRRQLMTAQFKDLRIRKLKPGDLPVARGMLWDRARAEVQAARGGPTTTPAAATTPASAGATTPAPAARPAGWQLRLAGGDLLSGTLVGWDDRQITLSTPHGELSVPVKQVREVWRASAEEINKARAAAAGAGAPAGARATEDVAFARKDDGVIPVSGLASGVDANALRFRFQGTERRITLDKLVGVTLAAAADDAAADDTLQQSLVLASGDVISGKWTALDAGTITLASPWGAAVKIPVKDVERVRTKNGRLAYLSDLTPAKVEQVPYFDRFLPYRADQSLTGGPIKLADGEHAKGLSVHSRTVLRYDVGRRYERFRTKVGFQQPEGKAGRVAVRVLGDADKVLHEIPDFRGDQPPVDLDLPVTGVSQLTLEVDFGPDQDVADRVAWAGARLIRAAGAK